MTGRVWQDGFIQISRCHTDNQGRVRFETVPISGGEIWHSGSQEEAELLARARNKSIGPGYGDLLSKPHGIHINAAKCILGKHGINVEFVEE